MDETHKAPNEPKAFISILSFLASLELGETLLYVTATTQVVSTALMVQREELK
jgi:hypothetical protein